MDEVASVDHLMVVALDAPLRDEGAVGGVGMRSTKARWDLVVHEHGEGVVAAPVGTQAVRDAGHAVAVDGISCSEQGLDVDAPRKGFVVGRLRRAGARADVVRPRTSRGPPGSRGVGAGGGEKQCGCDHERSCRDPAADGLVQGILPIGD